jgi:hypothetical protein
MELTRGQEECASRFMRWWKRKSFKSHPTFEISGAAGTGKTTLVKILIDRIGLTYDEVVFMTYVGKATLALARSGLPARTIHHTICDIRQEPLLGSDGLPILDPEGKPVLRYKFLKKKKLDPRLKLLVVDEGRMVPEELAKWILSYHIPVIVLGDLNQLDPVFGNPVFLNNPDATLDEIMRQAKDSPIPYLADRVIRGKPIHEGIDGSGKIKIIYGKRDVAVDYLDADIVICGKNKTREAMNDYIRMYYKGYMTSEPMIGDKLICRKNNWNRFNHDNVPLVNGMIGTIKNIDLEHMTKAKIPIDFQPEDFEDCFYNVDMDRFLFNNYKRDENSTRTNYDVFEYGYVITCHLAQGSQYNNVIVKFEYMGRDQHTRDRWLYTAVTRAIDKLTIIF